MGKIKVLTIQFDVTHLCDDAIASLRTNTVVQAEEFEIVKDGEHTDKWSCADLFNTSVREVDLESQ